MKKLAAVLAAVMALGAVQAGVVTTRGLVTQTNTGSQFNVGDQLRISFSFNPVTRHVEHTTIIDETSGQVFRFGADGTRFFADTNPCESSIFIQTEDSLYFSMTLQAITYNCVIPPLADFNLNDFVITFNTFGVLTSYPTITGN